MLPAARRRAPPDHGAQLGDVAVGAEDVRGLDQLRPGPARHQYQRNSGGQQLDQRARRLQRELAVLAAKEAAARADHRAVEVGVDDLDAQEVTAHRARYSATVPIGSRSWSRSWSRSSSTSGTRSTPSQRTVATIRPMV